MLNKFLELIYDLPLNNLLFFLNKYNYIIIPIVGCFFFICLWKFLFSQNEILKYQIDAPWAIKNKKGVLVIKSENFDLKNSYQKIDFIFSKKLDIIINNKYYEIETNCSLLINFEKDILFDNLPLGIKVEMNDFSYQNNYFDNLKIDLIEGPIPGKFLSNKEEIFYEKEIIVENYKYYLLYPFASLQDFEKLNLYSYFYNSIKDLNLPLLVFDNKGNILAYGANVKKILNEIPMNLLDLEKILNLINPFFKLNSFLENSSDSFEYELTHNLFIQGSFVKEIYYIYFIQTNIENLKNFLAFNRDLLLVFNKNDKIIFSNSYAVNKFLAKNKELEDYKKKIISLFKKYAENYMDKYSELYIDNYEIHIISKNIKERFNLLKNEVSFMIKDFKKILNEINERNSQSYIAYVEFILFKISIFFNAFTLEFSETEIENIALIEFFNEIYEKVLLFMPIKNLVINKEDSIFLTSDRRMMELVISLILLIAFSDPDTIKTISIFQDKKKDYEICIMLYGILADTKTVNEVNNLLKMINIDLVETKLIMEENYLTIGFWIKNN